MDEGLYESLLTEPLSRVLAARTDLRADIEPVATFRSMTPEA
ncbi:hypothetical protein [Mycobacterium sp.]|nr:hypothetical protein [Mycobacterium sp.]HTY31176.1 hypothetical protein [Mycobacterium sp.]